MDELRLLARRCSALSETDVAGSPIKNERNRVFREAVLAALKKRNGGEEDIVKALEPIADKLVAAAMAGPTGEKGDPWARAVTELADRLEGKPAQQLQLSGDEDQPLKIVHESK